MRQGCDTEDVLQSQKGCRPLDQSDGLVLQRHEFKGTILVYSPQATGENHVFCLELVGGKVVCAK